MNIFPTMMTSYKATDIDINQLLLLEITRHLTFADCILGAINQIFGIAC
jgi:hypothetical protein